MNTRKLLRLAALPLFAILAAGCSTAPPTIDTSEGAVATFDGLYPVLNSRADAAWAAPGMDLSGYTKIMLRGEGIEYRPGGESGRTMMARSNASHYEVTEAQRERLLATVREAFLKELGKSTRFTLVDEPGPDVLMIRGALLDVVSFVPPDTVGRTEVFLSSVGEATLVLEIRDSITHAIFARAVDRDAAEAMSGTLQRSNRPMNTSEVRQMVQRWARSLREALEGFTG
ncbi:MAG: DUF3313 domain-containing protein [Gammaproteobacteria bacterium]|jgi:hypothetical protein|nr:DUF3313 domain-containing protein [Gammaproteobacteria bacterium]MDH5240771.1 DUF3313 domain-containing protein [Gammaproteobacteria bacterium]MDH5260786.1 DUF3313 domain-containing protein [Gammaproteobacteria bacterium]MDH5583278.1 DUF3313 domain-containing protein [Gammaproteobacteria bacterium]